jgi:16S rRNA (guanine527-N7)-methyltransferase
VKFWFSQITNRESTIENPMHPVRIAELLAPFLAPEQASISNVCHSEPPRSGAEEPAFLSVAQLQNISTYIDILLRWNARVNLTAIREPEQIVTRHFGESLFAARHLCPDRVAIDPLGLADLGSGAGFPGIPIKLWAPHISLTLIESNHKKAAFLREVARALTLTDINILTSRAETISSLSYDVVCLRAVERFDSILPMAARLLAPDGRLALLIGSVQRDRAYTVLPTLSWSNPLPVPLSRSRILLIGTRL